MKILSNKSFSLSGLIVAACLLVALPVAAENLELIFPIAELGNCQDQQSCKVYCNNPNNQLACRRFAENHGLGRTNASSTENQFKKILADGGPGKCAVGATDARRACAEFCAVLANAPTCLSYAESHKLLLEKKEGVAEASTTPGRRAERLIKEKELKKMERPAEDLPRNSEFKVVASSSPVRVAPNGRPLPSLPPVIANCFKEKLGITADASSLRNLDKLPPEIRAELRACFSQNSQPNAIPSSENKNLRPVPPPSATFQASALGLLGVFLPLTPFGY